MKLAKLYNKRKTAQSQPIPGSSQVPNSAGGYAWSVDGWAMLDRFLILGSEDGTYYVGARALTRQHAENVEKLIKEDGDRVIARIVEISKAGRAPKNDAAIFALALAASVGNDNTRAAALGALPLVCRTGTHLFQFAEVCDELRGWGRGLRKAVGKWYNGQSTEALTYQLVKYGQRDGWSHRDLLRLAHPVPSTEEHKVLYKWVVDDEVTGKIPLVEAVEKLKGLTGNDAARLVRDARIPREAVPTELLNEPMTWDALLQDMPLTAMIRNLGNLSKCGLLRPGSDAEKKVIAELSNVERLKKARVHPIAILNALATYAGGKGVRGSGEWIVAPKVVDALDAAFYKAFANVEPTGKRIVVGLDVSGSMAGTRVSGLVSLECRQAAGAMSLVTTAVEDAVYNVAFDTSAYSLNISAKQRLDDVVKVLARTGGGGTDCALPMTWATAKNVQADAFVIYTDSETWAGRQHPAQALNAYRQKTGIAAKAVIVAMAANRFTIGDTSDAGTMTVVGFDASVPHVIADFLR